MAGSELWPKLLSSMARGGILRPLALLLLAMVAARHWVVWLLADGCFVAKRRRGRGDVPQVRDKRQSRLLGVRWTREEAQFLLEVQRLLVSSLRRAQLSGIGRCEHSNHVFCAEHLELECCTQLYELYAKKIGRGDRLFIGDFVNHVQAEEARHMARIFSDPNSLPTAGACSFLSLGRWGETGRIW